MITAIVDTCIIIDALQKREPFWKDAEKVFIAAANENFLGTITAKAVTDIYYLHHRNTHDGEATRKILQHLLEIFSLADTSAEDCRKALISETSDFEDAVMIETAKRIKASCIITRNTKDYMKSSIAVMTPEEFLKSLETS